MPTGRASIRGRTTSAILAVLAESRIKPIIETALAEGMATVGEAE
jgi:hypothetical protein